MPPTTPAPLAPEEECARLRQQVAVLTARQEALLREFCAAGEGNGGARADTQAAGRAKDDFLSMLGHELRNPVGAISAALDVLDAAPRDSVEEREARDIMRRQTRNLAHLLNDLLDVGRAMAGRIPLKTQPVDLADLLSRVQRTFTLNGETARHHLLVHGETAWVQGDTVRLEQVMTQLLSNALKYTPAGGRVEARTSARDGRACFAVQDNGPGIPQALLPRIFELFVQGERPIDRRSGGLGLGLPLVRKVVELHGGTVQAQSSEAGACFTVCLPAIPAPEREDAHRLPRSRQRRVLVIEDNPDVLAALRAKLELDGHSVSTASDGAEGLMRVLQEQPEISLVDIGLPGLSGLEVARHARAAGYAGRMVALSGYGQDRDAGAARRAGFDAYFVKPLDPDQLQASLSTE
jgi:nitrogen-specific signal transduction histidine kinase